MSARGKAWTLWLAIGGLLALLLVPMGQPLRVAWACYWLHENGVREQARVMHKLEEHASFALLIEEGPHAGQSCTADTSRAIFEATRVGDRLELVYLEEKPGTCELSSTIAASARLLWLVAGGLALVVALLVAVGVFVQRSLGRPAHPARLLALPTGTPSCPACAQPMEEGYLPLLAGIHWRARGAPIGLPHALGGLPGTVGWRGRPRLHAFRCGACEVVTFHYGNAPRS